MNSSNSLKRHGAAEEQLLLHEMHHKNSIAILPSRQNAMGSADRKFAEPVHLTPAWEEKNLPNDILNFKNVTMEQAELETNPPRDRCLLVYFIILIHGVGTLMPWNMFITAQSYFEDHKLSKDYTHSDTTFYRTNFMTLLGICSQVPNVVFAWLNMFLNIGGSLTTRIVYSLIVEVILFIFTEVLVLVDTSGIPGIFFIVTLVSVFFLNVANGIYQNTIYGLAAKLPAKYTGAIILGNNLSGIFTSVISIVSRKMSPAPRTAAMYYFIVALLILFVCFDTYFLLPLTKFYKYHDLQFEKARQKAAVGAEGVNVKNSVPYSKIFASCRMQCFNAFFIFFVTLSIFPSVHSKVQVSQKDFFISDDYYSAYLCFLTFNVFATIGNLFANFVMIPGPDKLYIPVVLRFVFVPLFLFCNYQPGLTRLMPVYITNDFVYWAIAAAFAFTSGYFSSLAMMYCGKTVAPEHSHIAGMFGAACLVSGIVCGLLVTFIFPLIVRNIGW